MSEYLTDEDREALAVGFCHACQQGVWDVEECRCSAMLHAAVETIVARHVEAERERIAQAIEDECPHEADAHPEGCCEVCDYAFVLGEITRGGAL